MRHFYTAVLERMRDRAADFDTEPVEAGWAGEAMFSQPPAKEISAEST